MPSYVSEASWADLPGVSIAADSEVPGLGVGALRTPVLSEVWRTADAPAQVTVKPTDSAQAGTSLGANTVRVGPVTPPAGETSATRYTNSAASQAYMRPGQVDVLAGVTYEIAAKIRRRDGATTTSGRAISATFPAAGGGTVNAVLPMASVPQGTDWQPITLRITPEADGRLTTSLAADTGAFDYELSGFGVTRVAGQRRLSVDLGAPRGIVAVALAAPRDGILPEAAATVRARLSATVMGAGDAGAMEGLIDMVRGYWCWVLPAAATVRYLQISITSAQPYLQFGRLWVGAGLLTLSNLSESGYQPAVFDDVAQPTRRRTQITLPQLSEAEAQLLEYIGLTAGTQRQVLAIPRVERANRTAIIGKFTAIPAPRPRQAWRQGLLHTASMTIQEDR